MALDEHEPKRVLVVEDHAGLRATLGELLRWEGYRVDEAAHGLEGLAVAAEARPDVIVTDLEMPVMDGPTFIRRCRGLPGLDRVPIVVMSARIEAARSVADCGPAACLSKPFEPDDLLAALAELWAPACAICAVPRAAHALPVFQQDRPQAVWQLCGACWDLLEAGFARLRPGRRLEDYVTRPGFRITDVEVRGYIQVQLA